jgi:glycosyltransferase involved in cell wall biosynthesis
VSTAAKTSIDLAGPMRSGSVQPPKPAWEKRSRWFRFLEQPPQPYRRVLLIFSQVFVPDPASVGQHLFDVAREMHRRGYRVRVYTACRGYDDPSRVYKAKENLDGIEIRRLPLSSFGKSTILTRSIGTLSFQLQAIFRGVFTGHLAGIFFSTSPPLIGFAATVVRMFRTIPIAYWAMDLNPDQLIAIGRLSKDEGVAAFLESANRMILKNSSLIIALDRFMAGRLRARAKIDRKLVVIPPWPHQSSIAPMPHETNPFREKHKLAGKFVVMYSGNHSPSNPLDTLLAAAERLKDDPEIRFMFIGGGIMKKEVEAHVRDRDLHNVICLPYQPLESLSFSLSAADVHVVALGEKMVGIIHPCKVYGAMAVGRPVLYFGPRPSHISDLLDNAPFGLHVHHGDVDAAVAAIRQLQSLSVEQRYRMGQLAQQVLDGDFSQNLLCNRLCDGLQIVFQSRSML